MANEDTEQSPWTRPGFVAAAIVVALVLILATVLGVGALRDNDEDLPSPTSPATAEPTPSQTADPSAEESVCGLDGVNLDGSVTSPIPATWEFQGTIAYPTSEEFGPGAHTDQGIRSCFQRSPEGAILMAANAVAQGSDPETGAAFGASALGRGEHRDELLQEIGTPAGSAGSRLNIVGFRLLSYDGKTATIDLAIQGSAQGENVTLSGVYHLVWQDGDWKISADVREPLDVATIPDLAGYVAWGA